MAIAHTVKKPTQLSTTAASLYLGLFFTVAALTQLFAFEQYPDVIEGYGIPLLSGSSLVVAAVIVCLEVLAIPFLLWMKLSRLMRLLSYISAWVVLLYWFGVGIWQGLADYFIPNAGVFGAKIMLPQGWWLVSYSLILLLLLAYVTWGSRLLKQRSK